MRCAHSLPPVCLLLILSTVFGFLGPTTLASSIVRPSAARKVESKSSKVKDRYRSMEKVDRGKAAPDRPVESKQADQNPVQDKSEEPASTDHIVSSDEGQLESRRMVPPEVVFFGDPRVPPPASLEEDTKYHGSLLYWARHATVAPKTTEQRLDRVFPKGRIHPLAQTYRLRNENEARTPTTSSQAAAFSSTNISYEQILAAFEAVADDLEAAKAFIDCNMDIVPSKLFLRALTAHKLSVQSRGNLTEMHRLIALRNQYILANNELFFPLSIEIQKAETRAMTYLGRPEFFAFAQDWDAVEVSLYFATLLAARLTWDDRVQEVLAGINQQVERTVGYMATRLRSDLLEREFRAPAVTADMYRNATVSLETLQPQLYVSVLPELRLVHETYGMNAEQAARFITEEFCAKEGMTPDTLKERLRLVDASIAAIQGTDYVLLRLRVQALFRLLATVDELEHGADHWYFAFANDPRYQFETYEPDEVPTLIQYEQRLRDTGNAFLNFAVEALGAPTQYSESFSGQRKKAKEVGDWLLHDPGWCYPDAKSQAERVDRFRDAYIENTRLRKEAEARLAQAGSGGRRVEDNVMAEQDRWLSAPNWKVEEGGDGGVLEYRGSDEEG